MVILFYHIYYLIDSNLFNIFNNKNGSYKSHSFILILLSCTFLLICLHDIQIYKFNIEFLSLFLDRRLCVLYIQVSLININLKKQRKSNFSNIFYKNLNETSIYRIDLHYTFLACTFHFQGSNFLGIFRILFHLCKRDNLQFQIFLVYYYTFQLIY